MDSGTKQTTKDATDAKTLAIRLFSDTNPMEDIPDQDSAKNPRNEI